MKRVSLAAAAVLASGAITMACGGAKRPMQASPAVPGAAEAVKQAGKAGAVKVLGLGLPSENKAYVKDGVTQAVILWKVEDLGYLTVKAATDLVNGKLQAGATSYDAGKLGKMEIKGDNILLGKPFVFTKENIDGFNF